MAASSVTSPQEVLLDTCVVIDFEHVELGALGSITGMVSAVTIGELAYGLDTDDPIERTHRIERMYTTLEQFDVLPYDTAAAKLYGTLASLVRRSGRDPRPRRMDLQIAATAAAHSIPVLTSNGRDFAGLERLVRVIEV